MSQRAAVWVLLLAACGRWWQQLQWVYWQQPQQHSHVDRMRRCLHVEEQHPTHRHTHVTGLHHSRPGMAAWHQAAKVPWLFAKVAVCNGVGSASMLVLLLGQHVVQQHPAILNSGM